MSLAYLRRHWQLSRSSPWRKTCSVILFATAAYLNVTVAFSPESCPRSPVPWEQHLYRIEIKPNRIEIKPNRKKTLAVLYFKVIYDCMDVSSTYDSRRRSQLLNTAASNAASVGSWLLATANCYQVFPPNDLAHDYCRFSHLPRDLAIYM